MHALQGVTRPEMVTVRRDEKTGRFLEGEWIWRHSMEGDAQIHHFGIGAEPACWMEVGHATGFVSTLSGELTLFKEVSCRSSGSNQCRVVGRVIELWEDVEEDLELMGIQPAGSSTKVAVPAGPAAAAPPVVACRDKDGKPLIVGNSPALLSALHQLGSVAKTSASVLLSGESGVGKELFANALHLMSDRCSKPFVAVNCAAIPDTLLEAELFGVERGAFTGAMKSREGRFERADGGTLLLDEIGTLNPVAQAKLLRVLQEGEFERVGGSHTLEVDVRIVAATNLPLRQAVKRGEFREDLFYRLNVFPIHLPPLRHRRDDISQLMTHFLQQLTERHGKHATGFTNRAQRALLNYRCPGNIRELRNLIERAVILCDDELIDFAHLFSEGEDLESPLFTVSQGGKLDDQAASILAGDAFSVEHIAHEFIRGRLEGDTPPLKSFEEELFNAVASKALEQSDGNISAAARLLGIKRHQLDYRTRGN
jgi:transcriptional regulator with GAF, ATPase, and Fis domain